MYLRRKIDEYLRIWKNNIDHTPLIIKGAKGCGKTTSILHFSKNYKNVVYINFKEEKEYHTICDSGYNPQNIIKAITFIDNDKEFIPHKTLIFFDEINEYPEIATSLKFFKLQNEYDVICASSLLTLDYKRIQSNSVGYKTEYEMTSFDFEEYLWAKGYDDLLKNELLSYMIKVKPFPPPIMEKMNSLFNEYITLGGMPKGIVAYIKNNNFSSIISFQKDIIDEYKKEINTHLKRIDKEKVLKVLNRIPLQLKEENKKFLISKVEKNARLYDYWNSIEYLNDLSLINICYSLDNPSLPLNGNIINNKFKLYFKDTSLLLYFLKIEKDEIRDENIKLYKNAIKENIVGEALIKQGYNLYYYKRTNSSLEEDFFIRTKKSLVPLDVNERGGRSKALKTFIESSKYPDIKRGIKLRDENICFENNIYTFPYFCSFLLKAYLKEVEY